MAPGALLTAALAPNDAIACASAAIEAADEAAAGGSSAMPPTCHS